MGADDLTSIYARRAVEGDEEGITWIVARFDPFLEAQVRFRLGKLCNEHDVRDLVSETWLVALRRLGDLSPRNARLAPVLVRFLGQTALNLCNNHLRRRVKEWGRSPQPDDSERDVDHHAEHTRGVLTRVVAGETRARIDACIAGLGGKGREVVVLRLVEGWSNQDVARILGIAPNTAAVRYKRALENLRLCLPEELIEQMT
jgi:RNA polymerase sigma factor (sigma-70 family)